MVVEVLSQSYRKGPVADRQKLCPENGAREFWLVDLDQRQVKVSSTDGRTATDRTGDAIPLLFSGDARLSVAAIFQPIQK